MDRDIHYYIIYSYSNKEATSSVQNAHYSPGIELTFDDGKSIAVGLHTSNMYISWKCRFPHSVLLHRYC